MTDHLERIREARDERAFTAAMVLTLAGIGAAFFVVVLASAVLKALQ